MTPDESHEERIVGANTPYVGIKTTTVSLS